MHLDLNKYTYIHTYIQGRDSGLLELWEKMSLNICTCVQTFLYGNICQQIMESWKTLSAPIVIVLQLKLIPDIDKM